MPDIVLTTLNAKYIHASFGLRYLMANLGELASRARLAEFDINQRPLDVAEALLARNPRVIGFGVYIWNVTETTQVIAALRRVRPEITIILGGPEVSYETEDQAIVALADFVITGEADLRFGELCRELFAGNRPLQKIMAAPLPDFSRLSLPYDLYTDADIAHRVIYIEASRGCPFTCEFCLSSLDIPVRQAPLDMLLTAVQRLLDRGVTQFKFVDRTFNLNLQTSRRVLEFFLERHRPGLFLHFEMIPDRLPEALREIIARFPPGALQFEVGVQTFNDEVCHRISRRQDAAKLEENFRFLRQHTGVHIHADLIVGLPGENVDSFAAGFDRLVGLGPQEIQVGILKRLRGTPIVRHDAEWSMCYNPHPPYEVLQTKVIGFEMMQRLRRFAKYWDMVANSGNFIESTVLLWTPAIEDRRVELEEARELGLLPPEAEETVPEGREKGRKPNDVVQTSPFAAFLRFADWLYARVGRTDSIALARLAELLFNHLTIELGRPVKTVSEVLIRDWTRAGRRDRPEFLRGLRANATAGRVPLPAASASASASQANAGSGDPAYNTPPSDAGVPAIRASSSRAPKRQARHQR